ncbi:MAG: hypothetical protein ACTHQQ_01045 [Solirubrobacteraceae bacterium]
MGRKVDVNDLIDTQTVANLIGLAHRNTVERVPEPLRRHAAAGHRPRRRPLEAMDSP